MTQQSTYLELSEDSGTAHKFYEVVVDHTKVTVNYGRIGAKGQTQTSDFPSRSAALAAAKKKIDQKKRKGYEPARRGVRRARPITRRPIVSHRSTARQAPVLWRFDSKDPAFGIFVDERRCWVGNQNGDVFTLTPEGEVTGRFKLPNGVKCLVADDFWIYAGCDDGKVYDLSGKAPRVAYEISDDVDIYWLDINDATLGVSDENGRLTTIDHEDEFQWARDVDGSHAWMVRCDSDAVYHGHSSGVGCYDVEDGTPRWFNDRARGVLFGWQERSSVYAGNDRGKVYRLSKHDGEIEAVYGCDAAVFSCAASEDGRYVFAGDNASSVYCFAADGRRLWKLATGGGSALSMQFHGDRLYVVTTTGALICIDVRLEAVRLAEEGSIPERIDVKIAATLPTVGTGESVPTTTDDSEGVVLECFASGGRLRMRVVSNGYEHDWNVQFPKDIREAGRRYVVEGLRSSRRGFYRAYGEIKRLR